MKSMSPELIITLRQTATAFAVWAKHSFDELAKWVTQLSWRKFILLALLIIIAGALLNDMLFSPPARDKVIYVNKHKRSFGTPAASSTTDSAARSVSNADTNIRIDGTGIHIQKNHQPATDMTDNSAGPNPAATVASVPLPPLPPALPGSKDIHISLPPQISKEINDAVNDVIGEANDDSEGGAEGASVRVSRSHEKSGGPWFMNFVMLLVLGLFSTKALMGGKIRAEAKAASASEAAENETLKRQVTESKMQMMQAQVEPHFLFNTLASVEHLIEIDPPRASAMQRSLIKYLRGVLPQMREQSPITSLGREADMVRAYLDLLKMRMEERLTIDFHVPEGLRSAAFPPMMLQSLVENAIKHGLECKPEGGTLKVGAEVAHSKLRVSVIDDGLGFGAVPSDSTGLGLQSIRDRLKLLHGEQAQLVIAPNSPGGVCATIEVPYQLAN